MFLSSRELYLNHTVQFAFAYLSFPHAYHCWFMRLIYLLVCIFVHIAVILSCAYIIHLSYTHADVVVDLLINSSMYMCVSVTFVLFRNNIRKVLMRIRITNYEYDSILIR